MGLTGGIVIGMLTTVVALAALLAWGMRVDESRAIDATKAKEITKKNRNARINKRKAEAMTKIKDAAYNGYRSVVGDVSSLKADELAEFEYYLHKLGYKTRRITEYRLEVSW